MFRGPGHGTGLNGDAEFGAVAVFRKHVPRFCYNDFPTFRNYLCDECDVRSMIDVGQMLEQLSRNRRDRVAKSIVAGLLRQAVEKRTVEFDILKAARGAEEPVSARKLGPCR